jgi:ABC-type multidrug transport system fused ATPase/permease subunit
MQYNARSLWVSRIVDWGRGYVDRPFLVAFVTLGWIPIVTSAVALDPSKASTAFLVGQALACLMVVPAPFDVWYYDERLLPKFFDDIQLITAASDYDTLERLATRFDTYYVEYWWVSTLVWVVLVLTVFVVGQDYFRAQGITTLVERGAYLGFFCYWLLFAGLRSHGGLITVFVIYAFAEEVTLDVDPLHPDGLGGLSTVGTFAIRMTVITSLGSLALPLSFQIANHIAYEEVVYVGVALFVLLVALNFVYPTYKVNRRAQELREEMLDAHRERIRKLEDRLALLATDGEAELPDDDLAETNDELLELEIRRARREFDDYQNVQLYPLSIGIITRLVSSILLPVVFILFELFITGSL